MDAVNHAGDTDDDSVNTKEADEGRQFKVASVKDYEAHNTATAAGKNADEAVGWIGGGNKTVEDIDKARDTGVNRDNDKLEHEFVIGKEN